MTGRDTDEYTVLVGLPRHSQWGVVDKLVDPEMGK